MTYFYISYSRQDQEFVDELVNRMRQAGIPFQWNWLESDIQPRSDWRQIIEQTVNKAFGLLSIVSESYISSIYNKYELTQARIREIQIIPILLDDVTIPDQIAVYNAISFSQGPRWDNLIATLKAMMAQWPQPAANPEPLTKGRARDEEISAYIEQLRHINPAVVRSALSTLRELGALTDGSLRYADLHLAPLSGVDLRDSDLISANLNGANLASSLLAGARLRFANLQQANLHRADLSRVDLSSADLEGADLTGANLTDATLAGAKLGNAVCDEQTVMPDGSRWTSETSLIQFTRLPEEGTQQSNNRKQVGGVAGAFNDRVGNEDHLGFSDYVRAFADLILAHSTHPPITIGIFGSWGMGKSFLLQNIAAEVAKRMENEEAGSAKDNPVQKSSALTFAKGVKRLWRRNDGELRLFIRPLVRLVWLIPSVVKAVVYNWIWKQVIRPIGVELLRWLFAPHYREVGPSAAAPKILVHTVFFNAWEYSANQLIWPGLVRKILQTMEAHVEERTSTRALSRALRNLWLRLLRERYQMLGFVIVALILFIIALWTDLLNRPVIVGGAIVTVTVIFIEAYRAMSSSFSQSITKLFEYSDYGSRIGYMSEIEQDLRFLQLRLNPPDKRDKEINRILVIIDDLDRCEPDKAVAMLQAIMLLLNFESFIVMLGIDARIISAAVEKHYKDVLAFAGASGYEYLDKIVQIPFSIPQTNEDALKIFIRKQMNIRELIETDPSQSIAGHSETDNENGIPPLETSETSQNINVAGIEVKVTFGSPTISQSEAGDAFTQDEYQAFERVSYVLRRNPRYIKRLINVYRLVRSLARYRNERFILDNPDIIVRWLVLCSQWPAKLNSMLQCYDDLKDERKKMEIQRQPFSDPPERPLTYLFNKSTQNDKYRNPPEIEHLDDDEDGFEILRNDLTLDIDWSTLELLRLYTLNFNPAIEARRPPAEQKTRSP